MKTYRTTFILIVMSLVTLAAGMVIGLLSGGRHTTPASPVATAADGSLLVSELQLSEDQLKRMRPIWEGTRDTVQDCIKEAQRVHQQQDEQLAALLTPAQRTEYARISSAGRERLVALDTKRRDAFATAVTQTHEVLRPDQWTAYQQILKNQVGSVPIADTAAMQPRGADLGSSTTQP
jgi:hypothetical protein